MTELSHAEKSIALSSMAGSFEETDLLACDLLIDAAAMSAVVNDQSLEELIKRLRDSYAMLDATKEFQGCQNESQYIEQ